MTTMTMPMIIWVLFRNAIVLKMEEMRNIVTRVTAK